MEDVDIVFASLSGELDKEASNIVKAMEQNKVDRLIFVAALGIYNEVPGEFGQWVDEQIRDYLPVYRKAADIIENSNINYTILRPAWLTDTNEIDYEITHKTDQFKGTEVSRKSVAAVAVNIAKNPKLYLKDNIGISKPNTNFNKPRLK